MYFVYYTKHYIYIFATFDKHYGVNIVCYTKQFTQSWRYYLIILTDG